jgi:lipopolysaccharide heptosyltransferase II
LKVFILKPSSLGDVVQALPVLRLIKLHLPHSEIFWWVDANWAPLLEGDPDLSGVVLFDRQRWVDLWRSVRQMREHRFDWVIDLQSLLRSGAMAWLANGSLTVGLDDHREGARGFYDIIVPRPSYYTHAVDWYLNVLLPLDVPVHNSFTWLPARPRVAKAVSDKWHPEPARWIALQPGARWSNKRWPVEYFAEVARRLSATATDVRFAIFGGTADLDLGEAISKAAPGRCLDLTGRTSLPEMVEWTRLCELIVTNDTGPMHVAAALGKPVVAVFGPTEPRRTGPYGQVDQVVQLRLPCVPCMKDWCSYEKPLECLRAITPEMVITRVQQLLKRPATRPSLNSPASALVD